MPPHATPLCLGALALLLLLCLAGAARTGGFGRRESFDDAPASTVPGATGAGDDAGIASTSTSSSCPLNPGEHVMLGPNIYRAEAGGSLRAYPDYPSYEDAGKPPLRRDLDPQQLTGCTVSSDYVELPCALPDGSVVRGDPSYTDERGATGAVYLMNNGAKQLAATDEALSPFGKRLADAADAAATRLARCPRGADLVPPPPCPNDAFVKAPESYVDERGMMGKYYKIEDGRKRMFADVDTIRATGIDPEAAVGVAASQLERCPLGLPIGNVSPQLLPAPAPPPTAGQLCPYPEGSALVCQDEGPRYKKGQYLQVGAAGRVRWYTPDVYAMWGKPPANPVPCGENAPVAHCEDGQQVKAPQTCPVPMAGAGGAPFYIRCTDRPVTDPRGTFFRREPTGLRSITWQAYVGEGAPGMMELSCDQMGKGGQGLESLCNTTPPPSSSKWLPGNTADR